MKKITKTKTPPKRIEKPEKKITKIIKVYPKDEELVSLIKPLIPEPIKGDKGDTGAKGEPGKSIKGDKGEPGKSIKGDKGEPGKPGKSVSKEEIKKYIDDSIVKKMPKMVKQLEGPGSVTVEGADEGYNLVIDGKKHFVPNAVYAPKLRNFLQLGDCPGTYAGSAGKFLKVNATETGLEYGAGGDGSGDVVGPSSSTDNAIARFDSTSGKIIQNSAATIADTTGDITAGKYNTVAISGSSTPTLAVTGTSSISGSNTGDQTISDATISTTDITTNNVSASKHGFFPKLPSVSDGKNYGIKNGAVAEITGGTGSPGGSDTYVQFNDGGAFGGDAGFTYNKTTDTITLGIEDGEANIVGKSATSEDSTGCVISIAGGTGNTNGGGGEVSFVGGTGGATGTGGGVTIRGGAGGATSGDGGGVAIYGGDAQNGDGNGGNLTFVQGAKNGSGNNGAIRFFNGTKFAIFGLDNIASTDKTFTFPNATGTFVLNDNTATLTNKRVTKRTGNTTSHATPTINTDNVDMYLLTAQAEDITSFTTNLSGTPTEGQTLWIAITGTAARAITWGASFEASTVALPTTTVTTNRLDVGFIWNSVTSKWRCIATS